MIIVYRHLDTTVGDVARLIYRKCRKIRYASRHISTFALALAHLTSN